MENLIDSLIEAFWLEKGRENESGCQLYTGYANSGESVHDWLRTAYRSIDWVQELAWSDAYRDVWISVPLRATLTFVEGDLILSIAPDAPSFYSELASAAKFYQDN